MVNVVVEYWGFTSQRVVNELLAVSKMVGDKAVVA